MAFRRTRLLLREATKFDADGLPLQPTWSLRALLASQPPVHLTRAQLDHLYKLSALKAPPVHSDAEKKVQSQLQEMIRLVEAVRTCPLLKEGPQGGQEPSLDAATGQGLPDGRIWPKGQGMVIDLDWGHTKDQQQRVSTPPKHGEAEDEDHAASLLKLAKKNRDGFYVAPSPRSGAQEMG